MPKSIHLTLLVFEFIVRKSLVTKSYFCSCGDLRYFSTLRDSKWYLPNAVYYSYDLGSKFFDLASFWYFIIILPMIWCLTIGHVSGHRNQFPLSRSANSGLVYEVLYSRRILKLNNWNCCTRLSILNSLNLNSLNLNGLIINDAV